MSTNQEILLSIQNSILLGEIQNKTELLELQWEKVGPVLYSTTTEQLSPCEEPETDTVTWNLYISKSSFGEQYNYVLDILRNQTSFLTLNSIYLPELSDLFLIIENIEIEPRANLTQATQAIQDVAEESSLTITSVKKFSFN